MRLEALTNCGGRDEGISDCESTPDLSPSLLLRIPGLDGDPPIEVGVATIPPAAAAAATAAAAAELAVCIVSPGLMTFAPPRTTGGPPSEVVNCSCGGLAMKRLVFGADSDAASGCGMTLATGRLAVPLFGMYGGSDIVLAPPATGIVVTVVTGPAAAAATDAFWMLTVDPTSPPVPPL